MLTIFYTYKIFIEFYNFKLVENISNKKKIKIKKNCNAKVESISK